MVWVTFMEYPLWARGWAFCPHMTIYLGFPGGTSGKESSFQCKRCKACGFNPWIEKIPLEDDMATHSSILAWRIPSTEDCGGLQSMGSQRVRHDWACTHTHTHTHGILPSLHCESNCRSLSTRRFPGGSGGKASAYNAGDAGSIPGSGRSPGEGNGNPLQYSCLENPWTKKPGRLQAMGSLRVRHDWATSLWSTSMGFPGGVRSKEHACQCRRLKRLGFDPRVRNILWGRKWQPTVVLLPEESHGQRILMGYRPWGRKESDTTEST